MTPGHHIPIGDLTLTGELIRARCKGRADERRQPEQCRDQRWRVAVCAATRSLTSGIWPYSDSGQDHTNSAVATATATRPALSQLRRLTPPF